MTTNRISRAVVVIGLIATLAVSACAAAPVGGGAVDKFAGVPDDAGLARLRACESGGNYGSVNSSGSYRGAYQFDRGTWNSVAARHYPELSGVDPAQAAPFDQDRMVRALWSERGRQPWPVCGKRV